MQKPSNGINIGKKYDVKQKSVIKTTAVKGKKSKTVLTTDIIFKSIGVTDAKFDTTIPEYIVKAISKNINVIKNFDFTNSLIGTLIS